MDFVPDCVFCMNQKNGISCCWISPYGPKERAEIRSWVFLGWKEQCWGFSHPPEHMSDAGIKYILATQPQFLVPSRNQAIQMSHMLSADLNTFKRLPQLESTITIHIVIHLASSRPYLLSNSFLLPYLVQVLCSNFNNLQ